MFKKKREKKTRKKFLVIFSRLLQSEQREAKIIGHTNESFLYFELESIY